ncbi:hypothetical protein [Paenibacillus guangzhouensis]|nr:hypothetical protein [Paenibacillus guangzhouensis]
MAITGLLLSYPFVMKGVRQAMEMKMHKEKLVYRLESGAFAFEIGKTP